jgi:catecholate siderophore receptor
MYGTSFDPSSEYLTITGGQQNLPPTTNETYEVGAKYDMFDNKLSMTAALFRVTQNNAIETVNQALGIYQQVGKTRVDGFELGIAGKITDKWSVFGGYSYMDSKVLDSAISATTNTFVARPGNKLANVPKNTFSLTSTYEIAPGLSFGGSAFFVDSRFTNAANTALVPSYWRFDAMAKYKVNKNLELQLNVLNIADTRNFESLSGFGAAQPGPGRTAILSAKISY